MILVYWVHPHGRQPPSYGPSIDLSELCTSLGTSINAEWCTTPAASGAVEAVAVDCSYLLVTSGITEPWVEGELEVTLREHGSRGEFLVRRTSVPHSIEPIDAIPRFMRGYCRQEGSEALSCSVTRIDGLACGGFKGAKDYYAHRNGRGRGS